MRQSALGLNEDIADQDHFVRFYERDDLLLTEVGEFLERALCAGGTALLIATSEHTAKLASPLQRLHRDGVKKQQPGRLIALDAEQTLAKFLIDGWPDRDQFNATVGHFVAEAAASGGPIHAFGEMVALLCAEGKFDAAVHLESLWNELSSRHSFRLFCAYPTRLFASSDHTHTFQQVCGAHTHILPSEHISVHANPQELRLLLATWEQKALALEAEIARRQQAQDQLRDTLINAPIAMALLMGPEHIFHIANKRYCDLVSYDCRLVGQRFADALPAWHSRGLTQALDWVFRSGQPYAVTEYPIEFRIEGEQSEKRFFNISLEPLRSSDDSVVGIIASLVDLTAHVRNHQQLQNMLRERGELLTQLRDASRAKDEFLAMLGHELRNPLAPIVTALQLMRMRGDTGTEREQAVIQRQVDHLVQLIADLLDISKVARGKIELKKEWIPIGDVLTKAVEMASPLFEQRSHQLTVDAQEQLFVNGDGVRLAQVVSNLLSNAARYTPIGGEIHLVARRDAWEHVVISVRDNGIGITANMVPKIFDLFFQGARDSERSEGGLGIGLALVKSFVELHGGTASVHSDGPGRGSEFTVRIPVAANDTSKIQIPHIETTFNVAQSSAKTGLKVLIVDDNIDAAETLAHFLSGSGHEVQVVNSPTSALSLRTFLPDLAILDIGLPVMDGYELAAQLRQKLEWNNCVFVALTGYGRDLDRERSKVAGFREHFVKPIDPRALLSFTSEIVASKRTA